MGTAVPGHRVPQHLKPQAISSTSGSVLIEGHAFRTPPVVGYAMPGGGGGPPPPRHVPTPPQPQPPNTKTQTQDREPRSPQQGRGGTSPHQA